ncbi:methyl-accepting chemotaxis protein [Niveispirillum sp. KHB5.9]|uniref:methyl-accepting chemotaxis protein n=1 Tax=Niveispirillum sp. KHB5.9 TaxID=3400269 RepID=UPI003A83B4AE
MFENISIRTRVIGAFGVVLALTLLLGLISVSRINSVSDDGLVIGTNALPSVKEVGDIYSSALEIRVNSYQHIISPEKSEMDALEARMQSAIKDLGDSKKNYEALIRSDEERAMYNSMISRWNEYLSLWEKVRELSRQQKSDEAAVMMRQELSPLFLKIQEDTDKIIKFNQDNADGLVAQLQSSAHSSMIIAWSVLALAAILSAAAGWMMITSVVRPVRGMTDTMNRLARHELTVAVEGGNRGDEIGDMARAVQVFKDGLIQADRLAEAQKQEQAAKEARAARINDLIQGFDTQSSAVLRTVSSAATELDATAQSMSAIAEETNRQAAAAAAAAEQTTANVQTVAAAAEEMTASITEINAQVTRSKTISDRAYAEVRQTDGTVAGLAEAAGRIGAVVQLIQDIAGQTNLLALNATIEAARAGEAGKGFAVVASEVKALANQTAKATEEIAAQVTAVQQATDSSVGAIRSIGTTIQSVSEIGTSIAAAMEEQGASTSEISRNVSQAAMGTQEVSANVNQVTEAAAQTGASATQVLGAARELSQQSELLRTQVERFLADIRAA